MIDPVSDPIGQDEALTPFQRRFSDPEDLAEATDVDKQELERRFRNRQVKRLIRRKISSLGHSDQERLAEQLLLETLRIACFDIRNLYHEDGRLKEPQELDADTAAAIVGLEVEKRFDENADQWVTKKFKMGDKIKAIELFFKYIRHLIPEMKVEQTIFVELAERLAKAKERDLRTGTPVIDARALPSSASTSQESAFGPATNAGEPYGSGGNDD